MVNSRTSIILSLIIFLITFFTYSGYYAGLGIVIEVLGGNNSRLYSIPLRFIFCILCFFVILKYFILYLRIKQKFENNVVFLFSSMVIFLVFLLIEYLLNFNNNILQEKAFEYSFYLFAYAFCPFFLYSILDYNKYEKLMIKTLIFSGFILAIVSIYIYRDYLGAGVGRISLLKYEGLEGFISPLALSYSASLTITLSVFYLLNVKLDIMSKIVLINCIIFSVFIFLLGASRGSILTILACFLVYFFTKDVKKLIMSFFTFGFFIAFTYFASYYSGSSIFERFFNISDGFKNSDSSVTGRLEIWDKSLNLIKDSPILGGNFEANNIYPHNIFLEALMSTGIFLFLIFLFITLYSLYLSINCYLRKKSYLPFIILFHGIIMGLFSGAIYASIIFFMGVGLTISCYCGKTKN